MMEMRARIVRTFKGFFFLLFILWACGPKVSIFFLGYFASHAALQHQLSEMGESFGRKITK